MGLKLHSTFVMAGLPEPQMRMEAVIAGGLQAEPALEQLAGLVETLTPAMQRLGVATAEEIDQDSLLDRMLNEVMTTQSVVLSRLQVGCWARR